LIVEGWPGIGKTKFLAEAGRLVVEADMLLAAGRADEIEAIAPLSPLLSALGSADRPVLERDRLRALERPGDQRFWLVEELAELLELRSRDTPIVVSLDDLQWADPATIWAVHVLSQRLSSSPVGWILAARSGLSLPTLARLLRDLAHSGALRIELLPLASSDITALAADLLGGAPDRALCEFLLGAAGNPFLSLELLQALMADEAISVIGGVASLVEARVPEQFRASVRDRLLTLSSPARQFLQAGSVFGRAFTVADVVVVLGIPPGALIPAIEEALQANVLIDNGSRLEFGHDLIRQAISDDMPLSTRVALHRAAASVILARGGAASEAAPHLLAAAAPGDNEAVRALQEAAAEISGQAPAEAAQLALRAVDLMSPGQAGWTDAIVGAVRLAAWASRFSEAAALAKRALGLQLDTEAEANVRLGLADTLVLSGRRLEGIVQCREALSRSDFPRELRPHFLHDLGFCLAMDGEVTAAEAAYAEAVASAATGDEAVVIACRIVLAFLVGSRGEIDRSLSMAEEVARAVSVAEPEVKQRFPQAWLASVLAILDRFEDADAVFVEYRQQAEEFGASWALEFCQGCVAKVRMMEGRLPDAAAEAEATLGLIDAFDMWHDSDLPYGVLALASLHRDDLEAATAYLGHASQFSAVYGHTPPRYLDLARALVTDARGDPGEAVDVLDDVFDRPEIRIQNLSLEPTFGPRLLRLAARAGDTTRAATVAETLEQLAGMNPTVASVVASAAHCRGLQTGDAALLVDAAERFRDSPRVMARASAFEDAGKALVAGGDQGSGAAYLTQALGWYRDVGALRDESRVRRRLRGAGIFRRPTPVRRKPTFGWDSLTEAELRVVGHVAQGLTNRQVGERLFLSTHTVATHLKHAFEKVGVASRVELTRQVVARGSPD
jgi:ATP/maltotriose-dependent transcriptional regulator MalT